uniref:Uncharacterized protein n=1 Tax=Opuntia streptacantha TaxID=393608 RepID=A0A7C8YE18_OPUST
MGSLVGHVAPGLGFFIIGLWHLYNHLKLLAQKGPQHYKSQPWFPSPWTSLRHLELHLIMLGSAISVAMELFIGPARHQPFDSDGSIPTYHLHNFEHSSISLTLFVYAAFTLLLHRLRTPIPSQEDVAQLLGAAAFAQELLLFHLHSADHDGVEGQFHWLLQLVVFVSLSSTLLGIALPRSFVVSLVRSLSIVYQGGWLIVMGFELWTPALIPKGCFLNLEEGHQVVRCDGEESLHRAKALVNIHFSWFFILVAILATSFYIFMMTVHGDDKANYMPLTEDAEAQKIDEKSIEMHRCVLGDDAKAIYHMER